MNGPTNGYTEVFHLGQAEWSRRAATGLDWEVRKQCLLPGWILPTGLLANTKSALARHWSGVCDVALGEKHVVSVKNGLLGKRKTAT